MSQAAASVLYGDSSALVAGDPVGCGSTPDPGPTQERTMKAQRFPALRTLCLALGAAGTALAQGGTEQVGQAIETRLAKERIESVQVSVESGIVVLEGRVRNVFAKDKAVEIALAQAGVDEVQVDLDVFAVEGDEQLGEEIVKQIRRYGRFTVFDDASAHIQEGRVTLFGFVTEPYKKTDIEKRMHGVPGIRSFANEIEVAPVSPWDDRLRQLLASRLYRDSLFSAFASMPIPPIHILVKHGRVRLTGVVNSQLARQKAEFIIRGTLGVFSVENQLRLGS